MKKPSSAIAAPMNMSAMYFHAASRAVAVSSNATSSTENTDVNSTAIHSSAGSASTGTKTSEKTNKLKCTKYDRTRGASYPCAPTYPQEKSAAVSPRKATMSKSTAANPSI